MARQQRARRAHRFHKASLPSRVCVCGGGGGGGGGVCVCRCAVCVWVGCSASMAAECWSGKSGGFEGALCHGGERWDARKAGRGRLPCLAVDETVILLHPPPPLVGASIVMERGRQQDDSLVRGLPRRGARIDQGQQHCLRRQLLQQPRAPIAVGEPVILLKGGNASTY